MLHTPIHHITKPLLHFACDFSRCAIGSRWDIDVVSAVVDQRYGGNEPLRKSVSSVKDFNGICNLQLYQQQMIPTDDLQKLLLEAHQ